MGDTAKLSVLVERYQGQVVGWLSKLTNDYHLAEDLVQEAVVHLYRSYGDVEMGTALLYRSVRQRWVDYGRVNHMQTTELKEASSVAAVDPMDEVDEQQAFEHLLSQVPHQHRSMVLLRVEGYTMAEVAKILGLKLGTVKSRTNTLQQHMRSLTGRNNCTAEADRENWRARIRETALQIAADAGQVTVPDVAEALGLQGSLVLYHVTHMAHEGLLVAAGRERRPGSKSRTSVIWKLAEPQEQTA